MSQKWYIDTVAMQQFDASLRYFDALVVARLDLRELTRT